MTGTMRSMMILRLHPVKNFTSLLTMASLCMLSACSTIEMPSIFDKGVKELPRYGKDATLYECENFQSFGLRLENNGEDAWVLLPDHEVGLPRDSADPKRYHYGTVTLYLNGDQTSLDDSDHLHLKNCQAKVTKK